MFSNGHCLFILISMILITAGLGICCRLKPSVDRLLRIAFVMTLALEIFKMLDVMEIVPVVEPFVENGVFTYRETGGYTAFLQAEHFPYELCSLQIVFMFLAVTVRSDVWKQRIYATIYGTALIGGTIAVFLSSIAPDYDTTAAFLSSPRAWEFFIYHSLIIIVALYIGLSPECRLRFADCRWMIVTLTALDLASFYINSLCSVPVYYGGRLVGVEYAVNYFSSYNDPLGIPMPEKWQHLAYLGVRVAVGIVLIPLVYLPFLFRERRRTGNE